MAPGSPEPRPSRIVVVGAGLSGLFIAHELSKRGADVMVLEATGIPGGRIRTVRSFSNGMYVEAGATHVMGDPDLVALIEEMKVAQASPPPRSKLTRVRFRAGVRETLAPGQHEASGMSAEDEALGEEGRRAKYFAAVDRLDPLSFEWTDEARALDRVTGADYLRGLGASSGVIANAGGMAAVGDGIEHVSALCLFREMANIRREIRGMGGKAAGRIAGGTDLLPRAVADRLGDRIHYGTEVVSIAREEDRATLRVRDAAGAHAITAARVVFTMPTTVLRRIEAFPRWSPAKQRALASLGMTSVTRMWLETNARFWADRSESGTAESDLLFGRVKDEAEGQPGAGGILSAYVQGPDARVWGAMDRAAMLARAVDDVERVHPGLRAHYVGGDAIVWDDEPFTRGAYACFTPGQLTELLEPGRAPEGVVHFAGDGTSYRPGFMQGAITSAKRVLAEIDAADPALARAA
ncbi:MAG: FAD-dependent oxidoreductase [Polyangiaceae bacterium]